MVADGKQVSNCGNAVASSYYCCARCVVADFAAVHSGESCNPAGL